MVRSTTSGRYDTREIREGFAMVVIKEKLEKSRSYCGSHSHASASIRLYTSLLLRKEILFITMQDGEGDENLERTKCNILTVFE